MISALRGRSTQLVAAFALVAVVSSATAPCVLACSCVEPRPLAEAVREPTSVVFVATVMPGAAGHVPVRVDRWFHGGGAAPVLLLDEGGFGEGGEAACQIGRPAPGTLLIASTARNPQRGTVYLNLCTRWATLPSEEGETLLAEATRAFGEGAEIAPPVAPAEPARDPAPALLTLVVALAAGGLLFLLVVLVARRSRRSGPPA
jgi:hypothetical protein